MTTRTTFLIALAALCASAPAFAEPGGDEDPGPTILSGPGVTLELFKAPTLAGGEQAGYAEATVEGDLYAGDGSSEHVVYRAQSLPTKFDVNDPTQLAYINPYDPDKLTPGVAVVFDDLSAIADSAKGKGDDFGMAAVALRGAQGLQTLKAVKSKDNPGQVSLIFYRQVPGSDGIGVNLTMDLRSAADRDKYLRNIRAPWPDIIKSLDAQSPTASADTGGNSGGSQPPCEYVDCGKKYPDHNIFSDYGACVSRNGQCCDDRQKAGFDKLEICALWAPFQH